MAQAYSEEIVHTDAKDGMELIRRNAKSAERIDTAMIEGANHLYTDRESAVARAPRLIETIA